MVKNVFSNHSMIEEAELDEIVLAQRKSRKVPTNTNFPIYSAPLGHVYSVLTEKFDISEPDIKGFVSDFNDFYKKTKLGPTPEDVSTAEEVDDYEKVVALSVILHGCELAYNEFSEVLKEVFLIDEGFMVDQIYRAGKKVIEFGKDWCYY